MDPKLGLQATVNDQKDDPDYNTKNLSSSEKLGRKIKDTNKNFGKSEKVTIY